MNNCLQELSGQYRQTLEKQGKQLNEKDEEILRLRSLHLKSAMKSYPTYGKLLELCDYNNRNPDRMRTFSSEEWGILLKEIDDVSFQGKRI